MNRILMILPLALLATVPHAQQAKNRLGLVNVQTVVKGMAGSGPYLKLVASVDADLLARQKSIQTLTTKANATRSAADIAALTKARQAYASNQTAYKKRIETEFKPLAGKLNAAVAKVAKANGFSVVLDERVAGESNLVIYAHSATSLTSAVLKEVK